MPFFTDQTGRSVDVTVPPRRIVSLVPSQTELLHYLGLEEKVVGITKFCVHPDSWFRDKTRIGGTKTVKLDIIESLQPDLILANKEENVEDQVASLAKSFPVWVSDVKDLASALEMIRQVGALCGKAEKATRLITEISSAFGMLSPVKRPLRVAYVIWRDPWMTVGGDTFIDAMLRKAGFENVFAGLPRYPEFKLEDLRARGCEAVLLSSEPYPFREPHLQEIYDHLPGMRIHFVDGELFSWYGSRMLQAPSYFQRLREQLLR